MSDIGDQIERLHQQLQDLTQQALAVTTQPQAEWTELLEEQRATAVEELHVTLEELRQQNDELVAARGAVEAERYRYQELFEDAPDGYLVTDVAGIIREANRAAARLLNVPQPALAGKPLLPFLAEADRKPFYARLRQLLEGGQGEEWEVWLQPRGRAPVAAGLTLSTLTIAAAPGAAGKVVSVRWLLRDITARKRAEEALRRAHAELEGRVQDRTAALSLANDELRREASRREQVEAGLRESEEQFRLVMENVRDYAIFLLDVEGCVTHWNAGAEAILGYTEAEMRGQSAARIFTPEDRAGGAPEQELGQAAASGRAEDERWHMRKNGQRFWGSGVMTALVDAGGRLRGFAKVLRDLTERQQAEAVLAQQAAALRRSNEELQEFAYAVSHDLQEPLRMVSAYLEALAARYRGRLDAEADVFLGFAVDGAQRMHGLIRDLLEYARVGARERDVAATDCEALLGAVLHDLGPAIEEGGAVVTHDPLPTVVADGAQLRRVFQNLLGNALKFRGPHPARVHVAAARRGGEWVFAVRDQGIGLEPGQAARIFVLFQRLHTREEYPGTGLGLAICKKVVERHGGRIWVESVPGQGATFYFTLPAE